MSKNITSFNQLISSIEGLHRQLQSSAANAVNQALTVRNWLIGHYIIEFEQNGEDRAKYGDALLKNLSAELDNIKGIDERSLRRFRQFYLTYPQIHGAIKNILLSESIRGTLTPIFQEQQIRGTLTPKFKESKESNAYTQRSAFDYIVPGELIISHLSYSHIEQLFKVDDQLKRAFYEIECIKGTWSVRELKRQINSQLYERSGLSKNPEKLTSMVQSQSKPQNSRDIIRNVYAFEFLELGIKDVVEESDLESALLDHIQQFILELGHGFCFEARQKRILIGDSYYFIDLLFYHRILKCHVLIELKIGAFDHGDIGQLNTYLNYFKKEIHEQGDNSPVGILLVAEKDNALVEYATAGMDKNLFVQQYMLQLPSTKKLQSYLEKELKHLR